MTEFYTTDDMNKNVLDNTTYCFNQLDRDILKSYEAVVDGVAALIGSHCEVVLHSLEDINHSAIRIANGQHTGRKIGSPITDFALKMLYAEDRPFSPVTTYFTKSKNGALMKSATIAIRNPQQYVIGFLCINMNLDVPFSEIIQAFLPKEEKDVDASINFASSVDELVAQTIEQVITEVCIDSAISNHLKNKRIVLSLYEKGIFGIKDAINQVADRLDISKHTVYLYVRQIKNGEFSEFE